MPDISPREFEEEYLKTALHGIYNANRDRNYALGLSDNMKAALKAMRARVKGPAMQALLEKDSSRRKY